MMSLMMSHLAPLRYPYSAGSLTQQRTQLSAPGCTQQWPVRRWNAHAVHGKSSAADCLSQVVDKITLPSQEQLYWKRSLPLDKKVFPIINQFETDRLLDGLYAEGHFPTSSLNELLDKLCAGTGTGVKSYGKSHAAIYSQLSNLLSYYQLPGNVIQWLPPIATLSLQHPRLLSFSYTCYSLQRADKVAKLMLSCKPHEASGQPLRLAVFAVLSDASQPTPLADVKVRVLRSLPSSFLTHLDSEREEFLKSTSTFIKAESPFPFATYDVDKGYDPPYEMGPLESSVMAACMYPTAIGEGVDSDKATACEDTVTLHHCLEERMRVVGPADKELGQYIVQALAAQIPNELCVGTVIVSSHDSDRDDDIEIPLWVLGW